MKIRSLIFSVLICIFLFTSVSFSQDDPPKLPEGVSVEDLLADEGIPEEIRAELEEALRGEGSDISVEQLPLSEAEEVPPAERPEVLRRRYRTPGERVETRDIERPQPQPQSPITPEIGEISSSGDNKISLDLKGVDIIDVLKMLSSRSNLNIVAGRNVRGRVTLFLKDVDVGDAFEIILAANSLAYEKEGDIINVMTERDYEQLYGERYYTKKDMRIYRLEHAKAAEVSKALNQAKSKIGKVIIDEGSNTVVLIDSAKAISEMEEMIAELDAPIETKVFTLNYAKAEDIKTKITEILTKPTGTIQVDDRTNKVIITDLASKIPKIASIIEEMDEKHKEVLIETKIVQVALNNEYEYGIDWRLAFEQFGEQSFDIDLGSALTTGGTLTLAKVGSRNINGVIQALETMGKTNVISAPRITVLNNEEAKVLVGTNQPYIEQTFITTDSGGADRTDETIKWIDVGVELTVTPTINEDGFVTMKIKPKISAITGELSSATEGESRTDIPIVSTSETETTVMVKDGTTIIIAGLIEDRDEFEEDKVPILGDIPFIGNLFKRKSGGLTTLPEKKELVVFLTPYIVHGTETFPESENVWYGDTMDNQRKLLEQQMSLAVEDVRQRRSVIGEVPPPKEKVDTATRISEDLKLFGMKEDREDIEELREKRARLQKEIEPARGTVPEMTVTKDERMETIIPPASLLAPSAGGYYSYFETLRNRIYWVAKNTYPGDLKGKKYDVTVLFKLNSDGSLSSEPEVLNDVDIRLTKAAKTAVEKAAPFPPFPKRIGEDEATFKITITYQ